MKGTQSVPHADTLDRLNSGPVTFSGDSDALYERHLTFDHVVPVAAATPRVKFEAVARSVRDLLSQRWIKTEQTYQTRNAKRVYDLSLEFLMGRSLANNITNLLLDPVWSQFCSIRNGDHYLHLADLTSYSEAHVRLAALYAEQDQWSRKAVLNIAASRKFSSDRTIAEYARDIWHAEPCLVD
jgi:glucan phosphorylase